MDHKRSLEGIRTDIEAVGQGRRTGRVPIIGRRRGWVLRSLFFCKNFSAGRSVRRRIVRVRSVLLPRRAILDVRGNHFEKQPLPFRITMEFFDVVREPVIHFFARGPGKRGDVAEVDGLFLHFVETSAVAAVELLEPAARAWSNRNIGVGAG